MNAGSLFIGRPKRFPVHHFQLDAGTLEVLESQQFPTTPSGMRSFLVAFPGFLRRSQLRAAVLCL